MTERCVLLLGGSFDPVHRGHVAIADYFVKLLVPNELRIIPAGNPWQKPPLQASAEHRVAMLRLAFGRQPVAIHIDMQEIQRNGPTYTIDTLRAVRSELGPSASLVFLLGADQLRTLNTWHQWEKLFDLAHIGVAARPGFLITDNSLPPDVQREFARRTATPDQMRSTPCGLTYIAANLAIDISATQIRSALQRGEDLESRIPARVLDYIQRHHLYQH